MKRRDYLKNVKRIVVKVGTNIITDDEGRLEAKKLKVLTDQIAQLKKKDYELLLVTSGAIAAGVGELRLSKRPTSMPKLQAAASIGQGLLLEKYANLFKKHGLSVGQVLITQYDITQRVQYTNAKNTLETLLKFGAIPIINENDTTAVEEIRFGENDTLAALVTNLAEADLLVLLTNTEGFYTIDPKTNKRTVFLSEVGEITEEIEKAAGGVGTRFGSGGMITKIQAAKIVTFGKSAMVIADGRKSGTLLDIMAGKEVGTFFYPSMKKVVSRKLWIAFGLVASGVLYVDEGAKRALAKGGKSLLPAGVVDCKGKFSSGDAVDIAIKGGKVFARGLTNFSAEEINQIKGLKSAEVASKFDDAAEEVIHRDCLVILK